MNSSLFVLLAYALCDQGASFVQSASSGLPAGEEKIKKMVEVEEVVRKPLALKLRKNHCDQQKANGFTAVFDDCVFWTGGNVAADVAAYKGPTRVMNEFAEFDASVNDYVDYTPVATRTDLAAAIDKLNAELLDNKQNVEQLDLIDGDPVAAAARYGGKIGFPGYKHQRPGAEQPWQDWPQLSQNFACMCTGPVSVYFALPFDYSTQKTRRIELGTLQLKDNRGKVFMQTELPTLLENEQMQSFGVYVIYGFCQLVGPYAERLNAINALGGAYWKQVAHMSYYTAKLMYGVLPAGDVSTPFRLTEPKNVAGPSGREFPREDVPDQVAAAYREYLQEYRLKCNAPPREGQYGGGRGAVCRESYEKLTPYATFNINRMTDYWGAAWSAKEGLISRLSADGGGKVRNTDDIDVEGYGVYDASIVDETAKFVGSEVSRRENHVGAVKRELENKGRRSSVHGFKPGRLQTGQAGVKPMLGSSQPESVLGGMMTVTKAGQERDG